MKLKEKHIIFQPYVSGSCWIPVKEQLPELMEFVLVHNTEGAILVARLFTEDWVALFSDGENKMGELTPTHWMPLPPPPACS